MLLADVAGHGQAVSHLSSQLRKAMHKSINTVDQSKLAKTLNKSFDEFSNGSKFATALFMTYFAPSGHLVLVNAGHPPPLICRSGQTSWVPVDTHHQDIITSSNRTSMKSLSNLPLGVIRSTEYEQIAIAFNEGDQICAYTDAYIEAIADDHQILGMDGLADILSRICNNKVAPEALSTAVPNVIIAPEEYSESISQEIKARGYAIADDDHTLLCFQHNGQRSGGVDFDTVKNYIKNTFGFGHIDTLA